MKKILLILSLSFLLTSCIFESEDLKKAKQDLGVKPAEVVNEPTKETVSNEVEDVEIEEAEKITKEDVLIENEVTEKEVVSNPKGISYTIESLSDNQFVELDSLDDKIKNLVDSIKITGTTLGQVDKIIVSFSNRESDYPIDHYTLKQFKAGDKTFEYNAKSQFKVLDYGKNEYIFEAHSGDDISKLLLTIDFPKPSEIEETKTVEENLTEEISYEKKLVGEEDDKVYLSLPKSSTFGEPLNSGTDTITYSKVNGLEIVKREVSSSTLNCESLSDYLSGNYSWFYWNTCRDIIKDDGISFYVLKLDGDYYTYEKHYVDYKHNLYGIYEIQAFIEADKDNIASDIASKNTEYKEKNDTFSGVEVVDTLFKEIVR